jgi:IclR family KDG regulon transcriptional repressor
VNGTFKKVPAVDKCFHILDFLAESRKPVGISEISKALAYNKSTVFNTVYTLCGLGILESGSDNKFRLGTNLYLLGRAAGKRLELIQTVHPFLEKINRETKLSAFLGIRSELKAVIMDRVDDAFDIKISSEVGMRMPLLAGAGGKALLAQLHDSELDRILSENRLQKFTSQACVDKAEYRKTIMKVREEGIAFDWEEYIEGIVAFAVPLKTQREELQAAIWAVGLKRQVTKDAAPKFSGLLKEIAAEINLRFSLV